MPGITTVPPQLPSGLGNPGAHRLATQNGTVNTAERMSVKEIKEKAIETVARELRGVSSAATMLKAARTQYYNGREHEDGGNLKDAFSAYIKVAKLLQMTMQLPEAKSDRSKTAIAKEIGEFLEKDASDLTERSNMVEDKLKEVEQAAQSRVEVEPSPGSRLGSSIADRVRALQENGLNAQPKRPGQNTVPAATSPRDAVHFIPSTPLTPTRISQLHSSASSASQHQSSVNNNLSMSSPHAFVPASSLGPPSPTSSPPQSPLSNLMADFSTAFPSIDELDGHPSFSLPSVPTQKPVIPEANGEFRASPFAYKAGAPVDRPSSTPITPITNSFISRPASPSKVTIPLKPSNLPVFNGPSPSPNGPKPPLPKSNVASPRDIALYLRHYAVLSIDVRHRSDFEKEHIKSQAIVCLEPTILERQNISAEGLEDAMTVAPKGETALFSNRDKFDLIVIYDQSSKNFGDNPALLALVRVAYEQAIRKSLKHVPMLMVGGFDAWKRDVGDAEITRSIPPTPERSPSIPETKLQPAPPPAPHSLLLSPTPSSKNPFYVNGSVSPQLPAAPPPPPPLPPSLPQPEYEHPRFPPFQPEFVSPPSESSMHRNHFSLDVSGHSRMPAEMNGSQPYDTHLIRRPAMTRPGSSSISYPATSSGYNPFISSLLPPAANLSTPVHITYPSPPGTTSPPTSSASAVSSSTNGTNNPYAFPQPIASPPVASINPSSSSRRRDINDTIPLHVPTVRPGPFDNMELRPPPVAASSVHERDSRRGVPPAGAANITNGYALPGQPPSGSGPGSGALIGGAGGRPPPVPRIEVDWPVPYWAELQVGTSGLKNLGNTCYMNAPVQCLSATVPFARFFTEGRWKNAINTVNPLGSKGRLTYGFAKLLHEMWGGDLPYLSPQDFRKTICTLKSQYIGSEQHDSQEFLSFLLDGIHEDLNRVLARPPPKSSIQQYEEEEELERLPMQIGSEREWKRWRERNDSIIVDFFQGQFQSRLECKTCHKTSTTYNAFSVLQLPIPHTKNGKVSVERCMQNFFQEETLEKDDAWDCPRCKTKRSATKKLSLARLPPVLVIHLKRFEANGRFSDKVDTFVDFPLKALDLTPLMPGGALGGAPVGGPNGVNGAPAAAAAASLAPEDPRTQAPPFKYDLYGVTNHYGYLSSGHYTAFIASRGGWLLCDDSSVKSVDPRQVVSQRAYVLFYKRTRA